MSVYLFNWTNPEATLQTGDLPILQQLGPYVFKYETINILLHLNVLTLNKILIKLI